MTRTRRSLLAGARDVSPLILGIIPFGLVTGAAVVDAGFGVLEAIGMSLLVNAGAAQLAATTLFAEEAPLLIAIGTALVINARLIIYSTSLAPVIAPPAGRMRPLYAHMLVDQSYAATMTWGRYREDIDTLPYYAGCWLTLASIWQLSNIAGALAGSFVPPEWSLDFAIPLVFMAMLVPALKSRADIGAALVSAIAAAVLVPILPMQLGLLAAIVLGMAWGAYSHRDADEEIPPDTDEQAPSIEGASS